MDFRERFFDELTRFKTAARGQQATMWTTLPGIIESVDLTAITCTVQPAIQGVIESADGTRTDETLPLCLDVPIVFPRGGGYTLTFPVKAGDECLICFSARCIDNWWNSGGVQPQFELRMHDLSDGFALVGPFSQATKISNISSTATVLRSDDNTYTATVDSSGQTITMKTPRTTVTLNEGAYQITAVAGPASVVIDGSADRVTATAGTTTMVVDGPSGKITTTGQSAISMSAPRIDLNP